MSVTARRYRRSRHQRRPFDRVASGYRRLRRIALIAAAAVLCGALAACARPVGDFGRAAPGVLHDGIMPTVGEARAKLSGEPVSRFNLTDEEREMRDRVWRFLIAPHAEDWFMDTAVELRRTRLIGGRGISFEPDRYYRWLHRKDYESSRVRFATVSDHARSDIDTAPTTFAAICRVLEVDRQRGVASRELQGLTASEVVARRGENQQVISWYVQALRYRFDAYTYALDHLLVETPHREAMDVDRRLSELHVYVDRAENGDFCSGGVGLGDARGKAIPSRVHMRAPDEGEFLK